MVPPIRLATPTPATTTPVVRSGVHQDAGVMDRSSTGGTTDGGTGAAAGKGSSKGTATVPLSFTVVRVSYGARRAPSRVTVSPGTGSHRVRSR